MNDKEILQEIDEILEPINEMAISKTAMIDKFEDQSEIYLEHIIKLVYFGDISASWRQSIWNVVANTTGYKFKETHKGPTSEFIDKWLMEASFGVPYLEQPLSAIQSAMEGRLPNIIANAKYPLPQPRIVDYPYAAENVLKFNKAIIDQILSGKAEHYKIMQLIDQLLVIDQSPYI